MMKRSLRAAIPAPDTDDVFTTPESNEVFNDFPPLQTPSTNANTLNGDDYVVTNPPTNPTLPPTASTEHHRAAPNPLLEVTTVLLWIVVVLTSIYYVVTEQTRRRRRLRRERQERLEVYSPKKQYNRRLELVKVLKATTMTVQPEDIIYRDSGEDHEQAHDNTNIIEGMNTSTTRDEEEGEGHSVHSTNDEDDDDENDSHEEIQQLWCEVGQPLDISSSSWGEDEEEHWTLQLPTSKEVPASCIICLKRFHVQEQITWSPSNNHQNLQPQPNACPHAFHQQCIIEWLAKLPDCNCPICRNPFCQLVSKSG